MGSFKRDKKDDEDGGGNPFQNIEKTTVLQEARAFNDTTVNPRKCTHILTKLLYLLNQGEQLGTKEATDVFFAMTKLFQSKDVILRRLIYLGIKELSNVAEDVIIVTSSLTKDMTGKEDLYRAAAIRALCSITDGAMLQAIERYMKQAIVDKNPAVSSAALVSSLHMTKMAPEVVKRWVNEAQEAVTSDNMMVQYHALGLLYHIRKTDRLAVSKLVAKLTRMMVKSPYALCTLIRVTAKLIEEEETGNNAPLFDFIEACLRHKSEMVVYEAAHAIVNLKCTTSRDLATAISVLQMFCSSLKPAVRFAAVRTLNQVAMTHPAAVTACDMDLDNLMSDSNRSIAILALTTLLKIGSESSVERLMAKITTFVSEVSDEFKVIIVQAVKALVHKYPRKHITLMYFLSTMLREEGGYDFKASLAETIMHIIEENPDAKEGGLAHLCEFIEDCEYSPLAVRILHLLGKEGPKTKNPSKYIRFIYNRVILEPPIIRAAAVSALAQFGATCPDLIDNIQVLLARCQIDSNDEVRDRATYYNTILNAQDKALYNNYILDPLQMSIPALERCLKEYTQNDSDEPFDIKSVPLAPIVETEDKKVQRHKPEAMFTTPKPAPVAKQENLSERLSGIPGIQNLGPLIHSSEPVELTESETEYYVRCIKHCYANHMVLQFDCLNTLNDQLLENVMVTLIPSEGYKIVGEKPCEKLAYNETASCYIVLEFPTDLVNTVGTFGAVLKYVVKDCDPTTGEPDSDEGYKDEYMLEDFEITLPDQVQKVNKANWNTAWEEAEKGYIEMEDTYALSSMNTLEEAVDNIVQYLGLQPAERSDKVPEGRSTHTLLLAGTFRGGVQVLVRAKLALSDKVTMHFTIRATREDVAEFIISAVG